ncbi:MAG: nucleotide pyrophosphohydrolase [Bacteroidia bacterium]|nr:nucleotide pyrophosphohydrolase [Bacteroidia bacterium]MDW8236641.1 nucleotide pyrophosphohydrolase [Bacteroidia bacterium]
MIPPEPENSTLPELQRIVDKWIEEIGKGYYPVLTNLALLMEEVGELARLLARHYGAQSFKSGENTDPRAIGEEMADILFVLLCLANQTGTDLEGAFRQKLLIKTERDRSRHAQRG